MSARPERFRVPLFKTKLLLSFFSSIRGKSDMLRGLKENVIVGHLIPAGTGRREYENLIVGSQEEYDALISSQREFEEKTEVQPETTNQ